MLKKVMNYVKGIREAEKLEVRSIKEWKKKGTTEEAIKVLKMQKDKKRNNTIAGLVYAAVWTGVAIYLNRKDNHEQKANEKLDEIKDEMDKQEVLYKGFKVEDVEEAHRLAEIENFNRKVKKFEDGLQKEAKQKLERLQAMTNGKIHGKVIGFLK
jgi:hypothetical protein